MKCAECVHANRAENDSMAYCLLWQREFNKSNATTPEEFIKNEIYEKFGHPKKIALGWGYLNQPLLGDMFWFKGTASESLMLNNQILISKEDCCHNFVMRG